MRLSERRTLLRVAAALFRSGRRCQTETDIHASHGATGFLSFRGVIAMGRRSLHTADELRELIIGASTELIEEAGFAGLSAREIARRINYSPGTLYNSFENLDELVLIIEGRLLDRLLDRLSAVPEGHDPRERVQ